MNANCAASQRHGAVCATSALCALLIGCVAHAGSNYSTGYSYWIFAAWGDPSEEFVNLWSPGDGATARSWDTGLRTSGLGPALCSTDPDVFGPLGRARAAGAVDLAAGSMSLAASAVGGYSNVSWNDATLADTLSFQLPEDMTEATVRASLAITGQALNPEAVFSQVEISLQNLSSGDFAWSGDNGPSANVVIGQTFAVEMTVQPGSTYYISSFVSGRIGTIDWCATPVSSYSLAAFVVLDMPEGVSFTSDSGVFLTAEDSDADGASDVSDNCIFVANVGQIDADGDGIGNACDPDFDNNCSVNFADLARMRATFFTNDPVTDLNTDGVVNALDLARMRPVFFGRPGPSAQPNACGN